MEGPKFNPGDIVRYIHNGEVDICTVDAIDYCSSWLNFGQGPSTVGINRWFYRLVDKDGNWVTTCTDGTKFYSIWSITLVERDIKAKKWVKDFSFC